jgi:hypothetical protein
VAVVTLDGLDHQFQRRIDNRSRFLGVEVLLQLGRSLDVRKQRRDRLALAFCRLRNTRLFGRTRIWGTVDPASGKWKVVEAAFPASAVPQSSQNADDGAFSAPHFGQRPDRGPPQAAQNFLPVVLSVPHLVQRIDSPSPAGELVDAKNPRAGRPGYRVVVVDWRGYGQSDRPDAVSAYDISWGSCGERSNLMPPQIPQAFDHRVADVNGIRLHYVEEGMGLLVILVHGFPFLWYLTKLLPQLALFSSSQFSSQ